MSVLRCPAGAGADVLLTAFLEEVAAAGEQRLESTRLGLHLRPEGLAEFRERLQQLLDEFERRPADPDGEKWSLYIGMHPEA